MDTSFRMSKGMMPQLVYVLLCPVFFIAFAMVYNPFGIKGYFDFGTHSYEFHLLILTGIILLVLLITRWIFMLLNRKTELIWLHYVLWCLGELVVISIYMALYVTLAHNHELGFFQAVGDCIKYAFMILVYPYIILGMWQVISYEEDDIQSVEKKTGLVKFYDENDHVKLNVDGNSVLYISAEFNYININHVESGKVKSFLLRNTLDSIESSAQEYGLFRCHRSYFINPRHIKMISKDRDGQIYAILDTPSVIKVPISNQYYDALRSLI